MSDYQGFKDAARLLLEPLTRLMRPEQAAIAIEGPASDHDAQADRLESFARPLLLAALWLRAVERDGAAEHERELQQKTAEWFRRGLVLGTTPRHAQYWGPDANYHQHHVEMGLMAIALQLARPTLWEPLAPAEKAQIAGWFGTSRGGGIVNNNHLFMSVHILEFLHVAGFEHRTDRAVITAHLDQLETMLRGGGWFEDGINQAYDHYNAYAFHFYGLCWTHLHGARDPERAARWREWARMFVNDYQHFFAASGEHPAFGRSITYRFNAVNVFGLAAIENCTDLPPGRLRRICTRSIAFFLAQPITQTQGCLSLGWTDRFDAIAEPYSCAASPYWAAKGFTPLLAPADHPFWTAPDDPTPAERGDFVHSIPPAGLLVRGIGGEVEILNAGSMVGNTQLRYGAWKWSKLAYRTGVSFTLAKGAPASDWSLDSALTAEFDLERIFGRHSTVCIEMDHIHLGYTCNFGFKTGQANCGVETFVWWNRGWLLSVHRVTARQAVVLRLGGYALWLADPLDLVASTSEAGYLFADARDGRATALQALSGFTAPEWDDRLDEAQPRRHIHGPFHRTPMFRTVRLEGATFLAALAWAGHDRNQAAPWTLTDADEGRWTLTHPALGEWKITHWSLPAQGKP